MLLFHCAATAGDSTEVIKTWRRLVQESESEFLSEEQFAGIQNQVKQDCQVKGKMLFMPIRVAVIGKPQGADLKQLVPLLSKKTLIERADKLLSLIHSQAN